jgi:hypothetical protein
VAAAVSACSFLILIGTIDNPFVNLKPRYSDTKIELKVGEEYVVVGSTGDGDVMGFVDKDDLMALAKVMERRGGGTRRGRGEGGPGNVRGGGDDPRGGRGGRGGDDMASGEKPGAEADKLIEKLKSENKLFMIPKGTIVKLKSEEGKSVFVEVLDGSLKGKELYIAERISLHHKD